MINRERRGVVALSLGEQDIGEKQIRNAKRGQYRIWGEAGTCLRKGKARREKDNINGGVDGTLMERPLGAIGDYAGGDCVRKGNGEPRRNPASCVWQKVQQHLDTK